MRDKGVRVLTVREILAFGTGDHVGARLELEEFAMQVGGGVGGGLDGALSIARLLPPPPPPRGGGRPLCASTPPRRHLLPACLACAWLGAQALTYHLAEGAALEDIEEKDRYYLSDGYKRTVLQVRSFVNAQAGREGPRGGWVGGWVARAVVPVASAPRCRRGAHGGRGGRRAL